MVVPWPFTMVVVASTDDHVYEVAPATGAMLKVIVFPGHAGVAPVTIPGCEVGAYIIVRFTWSEAATHDPWKSLVRTSVQIHL